MATIRRRRWASPSGETKERWQVDFLDQGGKRRHKQFERKKEADAYLVQVRPQVAGGTYVAESGGATIKDACDAWIRRGEAERLEPSTIRQRQRYVAHILDMIDPGTRLGKLTIGRLETFRDELLTSRSRDTSRKVIMALRAILRQAKAIHLAQAELTVKAGSRHRKRLEVGVDIPAPGEVGKLIESADPKAKAAACLAALAGLRASELRGLRWSDLDLGEHPSVRVAQRADQWAQIGSLKTGAAHRTIPLGETAARALKAWKIAQPPITYRDGKEKRQRPASLVFGTSTDRPDGLANLRRRVLEPAWISAGVATPTDKLDKNRKPIMRPKYLGLHCLRHYAVSSWLASGIDLKACQRWAGHATLALTLDTYGHLIPRHDDHQQIAAVERGLLGA